MNYNFCFITSLDVNVGDEFIREGICSFLDELYPNWNPFYVNKVDLKTIFKKVKDENEVIGDKLVNADVIIQAGAPVYWNLGGTTSYNVEWADELWFKRIFQLGPEKPILNIAAGACQPYPDYSKSFLSDPRCVDFAQKIDRACRWTSVRDPLASQILYALNIKHSVLPCSAFHAARRLPGTAADKSLVGINLMPLGGHFKLKEEVNPDTWISIINKLLPQIRKSSKILFIAHDRDEERFMLKLAEPGEKVFISNEYKDYMKMYALCSAVIANRVHGAVCAAGFGNPAIIIGNDSRLQIADYIGIPAHYVADVSIDQILEDFERATSNINIEKERLLTLRETSAQRYCDEIAQVLDRDPIRKWSHENSSNSKNNKEIIKLKLGSVSDIESIPFKDFMGTMNCFAEQLGLRQFTDWSKAWEYPWLWSNGLAGREWSTVSVLDLGSEISPMPWFLASMGAKVTLVECDPQWIPKWESLKRLTGFDVSWELVHDEVLPFRDRTFDLVTSFSVIEHQRDKRSAIAEVLRVLKPGGTFALSFDICEPKMGMTFPEWNGKALTMKEFEELVWRNTGFVNNPDPEWNREDIKGFVEWHLKSADHHNYTVGAAVLRKKIFEATEIRKILLPRFDTNGDIILLEGFIQAVLSQFPNAEVTICVRDGYDQLSPLFPERLRWITQPFNPWERYSDADMQGVHKFIDNMVREKWDLVIFSTYNRTFLEDILASSLDNATKIAIGGPSKFRKWQERVFTKYGMKRPAYDLYVPVDELSHEVEKYHALNSALFEQSQQWSVPRLKIPDNISMESQTILNGLGLEPYGFVACMPAGTQNVKIKKWPEERYAEVLVWLYREHGLVPLVFGHESEIEIIEKVVSFICKQDVEPKVWIGKTGEFALLGGVLKNSKFYLGNDSGPMHLAAALGVPVVAIFGGGHWPRFLPVGDFVNSITAILPCFYCGWSCVFENAPCVSLVSSESVKAIAVTILSGEKGAQVHNAVQHLCPTALEFATKAARTTRSLSNELSRRQEIIESLTESFAENNEQYSKVLDAMKNSFSWRLTLPFRKLLDIVKSVSRRL